MLQQLKPEIDINSIHPVDLLKSELGWTLQKIAEEMDYSIAAVSAWSNRSRNPSPRAKKQAYQVYLEHKRQ